MKKFSLLLLVIGFGVATTGFAGEKSVSNSTSVVVEKTSEASESTSNQSTEATPAKDATPVKESFFASVTAKAGKLYADYTPAKVQTFVGAHPYVAKGGAALVVAGLGYGVYKLFSKKNTDEQEEDEEQA